MADTKSNRRSDINLSPLSYISIERPYSGLSKNVMFMVLYFFGFRLAVNMLPLPIVEIQDGGQHGRQNGAK